jgi:hypothetical protein
MVVYVVNAHEADMFGDNVYPIGVYTTREKAEKARDEYGKINGLCSFTITEIELDKDL